MSRAAHFDRIARAATLPLDIRPRRVALLSGQSVLERSPLPPVQADFLATVVPDGWHDLSAGFPFDADSAPAMPAPFVTAAQNSIRQYLWAVGRPSYARLVAAALDRLTAATTERLVLITGSCGLAMFKAAEPYLQSPGPALTIIALGPVGAPPASGLGFRSILGDADRWSRLLHRRPADHVILSDHYGYWASDEARNLVAGYLRGDVA
jgi:hypothetical protein